MNPHSIRLDLDEFKPEAKKADPAAKASVEQVAEAAGFKTRHAPETPKKEPVKAGSPL